MHTVDWHKRYRHQATWTEGLRKYIFEKLKLDASARLLEVGCGTGAILQEMQTPAYGLDLELAPLKKALTNAPTAPLICGDAHALPYIDNSFDVIFSHFLWLWLSNPQTALAEMMRIIRPGGQIIAFAEPDYTQRVDKPALLKELGMWQREALQAQGADPGMGAKLAELFHGAGMQIVETGTLSKSTSEAFDQQAWESEWQVLESDLTGRVPNDQIQKMKRHDLAAWQTKKRILHVPTYYLWSRIGVEDNEV